MDKTLEFHCVNCSSTIDLFSQTQSRCHSCANPFLDENGLYDFRRFGKEYYFEDIPRSEVQNLLDIERDYGWREAVRIAREKYGESSPYLVNLLVDSRRANWLYLINPASQKYALEIGCGWGGSIPVIASQFDHVFAIDLTQERILFAQQRCLEMGLDNVSFGIGFDDLTLPFASDTFDLIAMNGVLAYIPELQQGHPRDLQTTFLSEIRRIIKPGGNLYIGSQNRFGWHYLRGNTDHAGLKWTSVMPRWLANAYKKRDGSTGYRNYTYVAAGYIAMLKEAGFRNIQMYWPHHNHANPQLITELNNEGIRVALSVLPGRITRNSLKLNLTKLLNRMGMLKFLVPSYSIVCEKRND